MGTEQFLVLAAWAAIAPPTVAAWLAWRRARHVGQAVNLLRVEVNHRLSELIEAAGLAGELRGRDQERERDREDRG